MPSSTRKTLRGSSVLVSRSQVVRPSRFLPLNRAMVAVGRIGSCAEAASAAQKMVMATRPKRYMRSLEAGWGEGRTTMVTRAEHRRQPFCCSPFDVALSLRERAARATRRLYPAGLDSRSASDEHPSRGARGLHLARGKYATSGDSIALWWISRRRTPGIPLAEREGCERS